jgi:putative ABC transport system permease protein
MRHAFRRLFKTPVFSLTAAVTLGAGIGANALIFSVVHGVLLKPLPFDEPERLVGVWHVAPGVLQGPLNQAPFTYFTYREEGRVFEDIGIWNSGSSTITGRGAPEQVESLTVTDGLLPLLGVRPALGRTFSKPDDQLGGPATVVLSHTYWQRAFNGGPDAIGQQLLVNGRPHEVIGVLPADFRFLRANPAIVTPFRFNRAEIRVGQFSYQGIARLKRGVTVEQANADVARLIPTLLDKWPLPQGFTRQMFEETRMGPLVRPLDIDVVGDIGRTLWILLGAVGIVLIVACANVATLFLVRAEGRQQELAVRMALGAGARRVARELLTESVLLGLVGGALGIALAFAGVRLLRYLQPARLPRLQEITIDPLVLLFALVLSLAAGIVFGVIPVLKYARPQLANALKDSSRGSSEGRERHRARNTLVVAQVALAIVLLIGSGLMIRTFVAMRDVPPGFVNPAQVLTFRIGIPAATIEDPMQVMRTHEAIAHKLEAIPGVQSVGLSSSITMDGVSSNDPIYVEDFPRNDGKMPPLRRFKFIGARYFETMGNGIIAGRAMTWDDISNRRPVVLISENFAREYWSEPAKAIGRRIRQPMSEWAEIIGVAGNERQEGVTQAPPTVVYWPMVMTAFNGQDTYIQRGLGYAVRTSRLNDPSFLQEVQKAVWSVNGNLPLARVRSLQEIYNESMAQASFTLVILAIASAVTLLLGVVGIYGVIAYVVVQRRREVGIRMALGARAGEVQRMFISNGMVVTGIGLLTGIVIAVASMRLLQSILFGVSPSDPVTYGTVFVGLAVTALVATWLPARQATSVDPALALRGE